MESLLERFQTSNIPQAIAITKFPIPEVPMSNWSYFNQLICVLDGSQDFRGYKQWREVNRHVVKGAKATFILVPWMKKKEEDKENSDVKEQSEFL
ncbi:MAG: ArdC-like ssDNA-binding domain-containing protein [Candidatus Kapabacteria bacterium]|nr:ArdC-like ssDNA-binding domain-containing protein [Candidatus Kapabacteria bacterium]